MYTLVHKNQTKLNDCWYACIQMIKSHRFGAKIKPMGAGVSSHRTGTLLGKTIWGNPLAGSDKDFSDILKQNNLKEVTGDMSSSPAVIKNALSVNGPTIYGGDFGVLARNPFTGRALARAGHYIVVVGVDEAKQEVVVHDPYEKAGPTRLPFAEFREHVWKKDQSTVIINDGGYLTDGVTRTR